MNSFRSLLFVIGLTLSATLHAAEDPDFADALQLMKTHLVEPKFIKPTELKSQTVSALVQQVGFGTTLMTNPSIDNGSPTTIRSELLQPYKVGYWRMPSFKPAKDWNALETQLQEWLKSGVTALILDVRDFEGASDFNGAAHASSLFCAPGAVLFSTQGLQTPQQLYSSNRPQIVKFKLLFVLVNRRTVGAAEVLAATLQKQAQAILVGRSTAGQAALYSDLPMKSGKFLRLATSAAILPDGTRLFGKPVEPNIPLYVEDQKERQAIAEAQLTNASKVIRELPNRLRISEAALVKQENPEIDEAAANQKKPKEETTDPSLQDTTLIRALDVIRGIQLFQRKG